MAVEPIIPPEWSLLYTLAVGQDWPEADEDALRRLAQYWTDALGQLVQLSGHGDDAASTVNYSVQAVSSDEFDQYWKRYTDGDQSVLGQLAQQCQILAEQLLQFAEQTEFTKISIDIQVVILLIQALYDLLIAPLTGGLSMGEAFAAMFFTRTVVREILSKLIEAVILAMLPDVITQAVMIADGHRSAFDVGEALQAGQSGLIGGLVGLGAGKALGGLGKGLGNTFGTKVGGLLSAGITGAVTNVATNAALAGVTGVEDQIHASLDPAYAKQLQQQQQQGGGGNLLATIANGMFTGMLFHGLHEVTARPTVTFHGPEGDFSGVKTGENTYTLFHEGTDNPDRGRLAGTGFLDDQGNLVVRPLVGDQTEHPVTGMSLTAHDVTNHYAVGPDGTPELTHYETTAKGAPLGLTLNGDDWTPPKGSQVTFDPNHNPVQVVQTEHGKSTFYTAAPDGTFQQSGWVEQPTKGAPVYYDPSGTKISASEFHQNTDWTAQQSPPQAPEQPQAQPPQQPPTQQQNPAPTSTPSGGDTSPASNNGTTHLSDFTSAVTAEAPPVENGTRVLPETVAASGEVPLLALGADPPLLAAAPEVPRIPERAQSVLDQFPEQSAQKLPGNAAKPVDPAELDRLSPIPVVGHRECGTGPGGQPRVESAIPGTDPWVLRIGDHPVNAWVPPSGTEAEAGRFTLNEGHIDAVADVHGKLDAIVVEHPRATVTDIQRLGEALRPGGIIVLEGDTRLSGIEPPGGHPHGIPERGPVWDEAAAGRIPPGYELVFHDNLTAPGDPVSRIIIRKVDPAAVHVDPSLANEIGADPALAVVRSPSIYEDSVRPRPQDVVVSEDWQNQAREFIRPYEDPNRPLHAGDFPSPVEIEAECGIDQRAQKFFQGLADKEGIAITVRPSNPEAAPYLQEGAPGKPPGLKMKTINVLDVGLGAPADKIGAVGYFRPEPPDYSLVPPDLRAPLEKRYQERLLDYLDYHDSIDKLVQERKFRVADGVVYPFDPWVPSSRTPDYETMYVDDHGLVSEPVSRRPPIDPALGLPVVGDYDMFELRMADGRTMPWSEYDAFLRQGEAKVWYEKYVDESQMTFDQIHGKGRETGLILGRLHDVVQHGAAVNYTRDNPGADPTKMHRVVQKTLNQHLGPDGEPLVRFEPGKPPVLVFAETPLRTQETALAATHAGEVTNEHSPSQDPHSPAPEQLEAPSEQQLPTAETPAARAETEAHTEADRPGPQGDDPVQPLGGRSSHPEYATLTHVAGSEDHLVLRLDPANGDPPIAARLDRTPAGWSLSPDGPGSDLLRSSASAMGKTPGHFDIVAHATPEGFVLGDHVVPFKDVLDLIGGVPADETLRLIACDAGGSEAATALAAELGRPVIAADHEVWISPQGEVVTSGRVDGGSPYPKRPPDGLWKVFHPDGSVEVPTADDPRVPKPIKGWEVQRGAHEGERNLIAEALNGDLLELGKRRSKPKPPAGFDPNAEPESEPVLGTSDWAGVRRVAKDLASTNFTADLDQTMVAAWDRARSERAARFTAASGTVEDPHVVVNPLWEAIRMREEPFQFPPSVRAEEKPPFMLPDYVSIAGKTLDDGWRDTTEAPTEAASRQMVTPFKDSGVSRENYQALIARLHEVLSFQISDPTAPNRTRTLTEGELADAISSLVFGGDREQQARFLTDVVAAAAKPLRGFEESGWAQKLPNYRLSAWGEPLARTKELRLPPERLSGFEEEGYSLPPGLPPTTEVENFLVRIAHLVGHIEVSRNPSAIANLMAVHLAETGCIHLGDMVGYFNVMSPRGVGAILDSAAYERQQGWNPMSTAERPKIPSDVRGTNFSEIGSKTTNPDIHQQIDLYRQRQCEVITLYTYALMDGLPAGDPQRVAFGRSPQNYIADHVAEIIDGFLASYLGSGGGGTP